ncbi:MAG: carboxypeptidase regulatory-like domain-containing protein [bacterium]|nr:carboxypeptidase regulatory-like domain-containing protein [bacterium]
MYRTLVPVLFAALALFWAPAAMANGATDGTVTLPLNDYLDLVERIERAAEADGEEPETPIAALTAQATRATVTGDVADLHTTYRVELRGRPTSPVVLPVTGLPESFSVEPSTGTALHRAKKNVVLVAPLPGSYTVTIRSRVALDLDGGVSRLLFAKFSAPVSSLDLDLPEDLSWTCADAVLVEESTSVARRQLRLAPKPDSAPAFTLKRRVTGAAEEQARARAVVVTVARVAERGVERRDVVLYEVERGELGRFEVDVPAPLEVAHTETDEGTALPLLEGGRLVVEREHRLSGLGHLAIELQSRSPDAQGEVPLPLILPRVPVRSRYLVLASDRAADVEPLPRDGWSRVDIEDLPGSIGDEIAALGPNAVWRLTDDAGEPRLRTTLFSEVEQLAGVVRKRSTTTLLTMDGSLVHREELTLEHPGAALELSLPTGATLWSVRIDGQAVRPVERSTVERGAALAIPLLYKAEGSTEVELVAVEQRTLTRGASRLPIELTRVDLPVLEHQWRILLPEQHRYRLAASDLRRAPVSELTHRATPVASVIDSIGESRAGGSRVKNFGAGDSGIVVKVADESGSALPGVTVTAETPGRRAMVLLTDSQGRVRFVGLAGGAYEITAELEGFTTLVQKSRVAPGLTTHVALSMQIAAIAEEIIVTSTVQTLGATSFTTTTYQTELEQQQMKDAARQELVALGQGLVGGVKPLAVDIPESGKLLLLAGALPPPSVSAELEVKMKR